MIQIQSARIALEPHSDGHEIVYVYVRAVLNSLLRAPHPVARRDSLWGTRNIQSVC